MYLLPFRGSCGNSRDGRQEIPARISREGQTDTKMSAKVKISYQDEKELYELLELLEPAVRSWKKAEAAGAYKRAYVDIKDLGESACTGKGKSVR